jgi:F-type H+-transporting ATPase subunit alpha
MSADALRSELPTGIGEVARPARALLEGLAAAPRGPLTGSLERIGVVERVADAVALVSTIPGTLFGELLAFPGGVEGMVFDLERETTGCVLLGDDEGIRTGDLVRRTGAGLRVPVGPDFIGRVIDPLGRPLDGGDPPAAEALEPIERPAPTIAEREPVTRPLLTGIKSVDAMIPIGRGQRELIVGDRSTGKTALALDAILNQRDQGVLCIYAGIGQRTSSTAGVLAALKRREAFGYTAAVVADADDPPGLLFAAPFAAMTLGEHFCRQGRDVLVVLDDLTKHAQAYRQISLLLRRPPGREAYPGDIFYLHSRLLERATQLSGAEGGGSLTALPIIETQAGNIISITDGQICLSTSLFSHGLKPAVDVGLSVSRVGGQAQRPEMRTLAGPLRVGYTQFEELEIFTRFGARVEEATRVRIERGRRIRAVLSQPRFEPVPVADEVVVLLTVTRGLADDVPLDRIPEMERLLRREVRERLPEIARQLAADAPLADDDRALLVETIRRVIQEMLRADAQTG